MDIITPKNSEHFIFRNEDGTAKLSGRDQGIRKCTWKRDQPERGEELRDDLRGESDGSQPIDTMMDDTDARNDFWSIEGIDTFIVITSNQEFSSMCRRKNESFPIPLQFFDAVRRTHTSLDVFPECGIYNVLEHWWRSNLSEPVTDFTQFTVWTVKTSRRMWSGERLTHIHHKTWSSVARNLVQNVTGSSTKRKSSNGLSKNRSPTMPENWEASVILTGMNGVQRNH